MIRRARTAAMIAAAATAMAGLIAAGPATAAAAAANPAPAVVPALQQWSGGSGTFTFGSRIVIDPAAVPALGADAHTFASDLAAITGARPAVVTSAQPHAGDIVVTLDPAVGHAQGYRLTIGSTVTIAGSDQTGAFYGEQTVEQMLKLSHGSGQLPRGTAVDWPGSGYRGVMLDAGRHYYSVASILDEIREEAWDKLDEIHLHFTDQNAFRLVSTTYPGLAAPQAYTHADIARIVAYAHKYHVTVVPEIDVPGHAVPIGQYDPSLQWDCASMNASSYQYWPGFTLDITNPATTTFVTNLLKEFVPLFRYSPVIHLGGDEYPELAAQQQCPELVNYAQASGYASTEDVFVAWQNQMAAVVSSMHKRAEIWNWWDVAGGATIAPDTSIIIDAWTGTPDDYASAGYDTVSSSQDDMYVTPGADPGGAGTPDGTLYDDWTPDTSSHLLGYEVSRWSDSAVTMPDSYFDWFASRTEQIVADRSWGAPAAYPDQFAFEDAVDQLGTAPGVPENGDPDAVLLTGAPYGTSPPYEAGNGYQNVFDGNPDTFFDYSQANGGYAGIDLGAGHAASVTKIRFVPRSSQPGRMTGGQFQGCADGPDSGCHTLATVTWTPNGSDWTELTVSDPAKYRWLRYLSPDGSYGNVAEVQFYTAPRQAGHLSVTAPVTIRRGGHGSATTTLTNTGTQPLQLSRLTLTAVSEADDSMLRATPASPLAAGTVLPPGGKLAVTWRLAAGAAAAASSYRLTARALTTSGGPGITQASATATTLVPAQNLAAAFSNAGITSDSDPSADIQGGFDASGDTYSQQAFDAATAVSGATAPDGAAPGSQISYGGATFTMPDVAAGTPDNVSGGGPVVALHGSGTSIAFLGSDAGSVADTVTVTYADGSTSAGQLGFPGWCCSSGATDWGSTAVVQSGYRDIPVTGPANQGLPYDLYYNAIPITPGKKVVAVTLPQSSSIHVFALAIGSFSDDNNTGVSADGQTVGPSFDGGGYLYSANALAADGITAGATVTSGGVSYTWPGAAPGQPDNIEAFGQTIAVRGHPASPTIGLLGSASDTTCDGASGTLTVTYTDGSTQDIGVTFSDWALGGGGCQPASGDSVVAQIPYRNTSAGGQQTLALYLFSVTAALQPGKTVASLTLPASSNGTIHIFAISI